MEQKFKGHVDLWPNLQYAECTLDCRAYEMDFHFATNCVLSSKSKTKEAKEEKNEKIIH